MDYLDYELSGSPSTATITQVLEHAFYQLWYNLYAGTYHDFSDWMIGPPMAAWNEYQSTCGGTVGCMPPWYEVIQSRGDPTVAWMMLRVSDIGIPPLQAAADIADAVSKLESLGVDEAINAGLGLLGL